MFCDCKTEKILERMGPTMTCERNQVCTTCRIAMVVLTSIVGIASSGGRACTTLAIDSITLFFSES